MIFNAIVVFCLTFLIFTSELAACTGILLQADDKSIVTGRTVEFGSDIEMSVAVIPRNFKFIGDVPNGDGMAYTSKYAAAGIYCFDNKVLMDGMNEKGLVAAAFYFPGFADYAKISKGNQTKALSPVEFPNWILTQFATIEEVRAALNSVLIAPTVVSNWGVSPPPMHYIVYDQNGKSIVIEPLHGTLVVYENEIGVLTNSPTFDWHLTNLRNYINLTPFNVEPIHLRGLELAPFGEGSGMVGLPGDFTPPSRFVRAAIFSAAEIPSKNSDESVSKAFHILNQFDIPAGLVRQKDQTKFSVDYTLLTSVKDPNAMKYYYRSYGDQTMRFVDLKEFDLDGKTIKSVKTNEMQKNVDASALLN